MDLRHFKFASGEECICEVVSWNDEETDTIVIRKALKIISVEDIEEGLRYYTFKPFMSMNNDAEAMVVINSYHILADALPAPAAEKSYHEIIKEMNEFHAEEMLEFKADDFEPDSDGTSNIVQFSKKLLH